MSTQGTVTLAIQTVLFSGRYGPRWKHLLVLMHEVYSATVHLSKVCQSKGSVPCLDVVHLLLCWLNELDFGVEVFLGAMWMTSVPFTRHWFSDETQKHCGVLASYSHGNSILARWKLAFSVETPTSRSALRMLIKPSLCHASTERQQQ